MKRKNKAGGRKRRAAGEARAVSTIRPAAGARAKRVKVAKRPQEEWWRKPAAGAPAPGPAGPLVQQPGPLPWVQPRTLPWGQPYLPTVMRGGGGGPATRDERLAATGPLAGLEERWGPGLRGIGRVAKEMRGERLPVPRGVLRGAEVAGQVGGVLEGLTRPFDYAQGDGARAGLAEVAGKPGPWMLGTAWMPPVELKPEEVLRAPTMPVATAEQTGRRIGKAWEGLGAAAEERQLPGAWGAVREQMGAGRPLPAEVTKPGAWMLGPGFIPPAEMRPEEAAAGMEQAGQVAALLGPVWHDVKQVPVVGKPARGVEAALKSGFELIFQAPVSAVEEAIGRGITQNVEGKYAVIPLAPGRYLTEEMQGRAETLAGGTGTPLWLAQQRVLAEERRGAPAVRELAMEQYGPGPETERALGRLGLMAYSSYEAQVEGMQRLMGGEEIETVISGRRIDTYEPGAEDVGAFRAYVEGVRARDGDEAAEAAGQRVVETGSIPGSSDLGNEIVGQMVFDPMNFVGMGAKGRAADLAEAKAAGRYTEVATQHGDEVADGVRVALGHTDEAARALGHTDDADAARVLREVFEKYNPLAPTERAAAETAANTVYQVVTPGLMEVGSADEAKAVVRALVDDPARLMGAMGPIPVSEAAEEARPLLEAVAGKLDDFKSLRGREFDRLAFLEELDAAVMDTALELGGVGAEEVGAYRKFANGYRSLTSEFYLRTPGYASRNAMGDLVTMAWDGVLTLDGRGQIDDFLKRYGPTTRRMRGVAGGPQAVEMLARESRLPGVLGKASRWAGKKIGAMEEGRYTRAFYKALTDTHGRTWRPVLPDELRGLVSPEVADAVEVGLRKGVNGDEFLAAVDKALGADRAGGLVDVGRYLDRPDDLSVGLRLDLETKLAGLTDVGDVDGVMDEAVEGVRAQTGRALAADPVPPGRREWSQIEALQDVREEQGAIEGMGWAMGGGDDEITAAQRVLEEALAPGEARINEAEEALAAQVGTHFDEDGANLLRSVRAETGRGAMEVRAEADRLRAEAWKTYRELREQGRPAAHVWQTYFADVARLRLDEQTKRAGQLDESLGLLKRMARGETLEEVVGRPGQALVDASLDELRSLAGSMAARQSRLKRLGLEEFVDFDKMLDARRLAVDTAEAEAWRLLAVNPGRDGLDVVMSAQRWVDEAGRAAAAEMASARDLMLSGKMSLKKYHEVGEKIWGGYFRDGGQVWDLAKWELGQLPLSPGAQQRALGALGWPAEAVAKLGPDEVKAVLGGGVRWDALVGGPVMPIEDAMKGTMAEVAQAAGLEVGRSADWTPAQWDGVRLAAEQLRDQAGVQASKATRMGQAAVEVAGEAATGAARTVEAGMDLAWPANVDDVARSMGIRPQVATGEDWARVAEYAGGRAGGGVEAERWLEMGEEAGRRATILEQQQVAGEATARAMGLQVAPQGRGPRAFVVMEPGMYDAAGRPVAREAVERAGRQQLEVVERAVGMVPEAERRGRGVAAVGFEQRQAYLAQRYGDVADTAAARAGLLREGRRLGEAVDVPAGIVKATTRKDAGIYLLDLVDEEKRVIRTYWFDSWPETRRARDGAREVIAAGRQGEGALTGTAVTAWRTDDVVRADRAAAAAGGYAGPPTLADAAMATEQQELAAIERVREGLKGDWGRLDEVAKTGEVSPQTRNRFRQWVKGDMGRAWAETRTVEVETARQLADFALLDYSGGRKQVDNWLSLAFPYTFWKTRSARNWAMRMAARPGALGQFVRFRRATERQNAERGYRGRFEGKVEIPVKGLPEWTGQAVFLDPEAMLMPWSQVLGPDWTDDPAEAENAVDYVHRSVQKLGLRPYGFIEWPLQYFGWIGEKSEIGYALPHTGAVQALTAGARELSPEMARRIPPGGWSPETAVRRGVGLPEQEPYQAYRVSRMLSGMAGQDPEATQASLLAMELQRLVATGELSLEEAMAEGGGNVERLGEVEGWSAEELAAGQGMLREAVQRAGLERGLTAATSFGAGVSLSMYPAGERRQVELQRERRGEMYSPLTGRGGREQYKAWEEEHPEEVTRRVMYGALPGAEEYEGWTPGEARASRAYKKEAEEINRTYDEAADELLKREPWNKAEVRELEDQRQAELDVLRDRYGFGAPPQPPFLRYDILL